MKLFINFMFIILLLFGLWRFFNFVLYFIYLPFKRMIFKNYMSLGYRLKSTIDFHYAIKLNMYVEVYKGEQIAFCLYDINLRTFIYISGTPLKTQPLLVNSGVIASQTKYGVYVNRLGYGKNNYSFIVISPSSSKGEENFWNNSLEPNNWR